MTTNPTTLPLFDFEPDWSPNLRASLRYPSNVCAAPHGDEQRELLSSVPIRALKIAVKTESLTEARRLGQFLRDNIGSKITVPLWSDAVAVTSAASGNSIAVATTELREFAADGWAIIWNFDGAVSCELFQIASVAAAELTVSGAGLVGTYPQGSLVAPVMIARLKGNTTEALWVHSDASAAAVEFAECIEESSAYSPIIPASFTWSPADITGTNRMWLDDARLVGLDGEAIATWQDRLGAFNLSQATAGYRPIKKTNILGSRSVARFDGSNDYLTTATNMSWIKSMLIVGIKSQAHDVFGEFSAGNHRGFFGWNYPPYDWFTNYFLNGTSDNPSNWQNNFLWNVLFGSGNGYPADYSYFRVGYGTPDYVFLGGDIACLIAYDTVLSESDQQKLEGWAAWTYGLQAKLPVGHPYKLAAP